MAIEHTPFVVAATSIRPSGESTIAYRMCMPPPPRRYARATGFNAIGEGSRQAEGQNDGILQLIDDASSLIALRRSRPSST